MRSDSLNASVEAGIGPFGWGMLGRHLGTLFVKAVAI
jgi:hypothetical protein